MAVSTPISTCAKNVVCLIGNVRRQTIVRVSDAFQHSSCCCCTFNKHGRLNYFTTNAKSNSFQAFKGDSFGCHSLTFKGLVGPRRYGKVHVNVGYEDTNLRLLMGRRNRASKVKCSVGPFSFRQRGVSAGFLIGLMVCFSTAQPSYAESPEGNETRGNSSSSNSNNKKVLADYCVIGIPGDGRCLFRSVAHGACIRLGNPAPNEDAQRELADELRARVADEFIKRREETEWFIEGDFDKYISQIRKPHVWGGEPELLMASHVLQMPITVYMRDEDSGGLISIAEYGQEYGKDNPIRVLYHGYGHYDALHLLGKGGARPRL
ncbi:OVARIAN TUMOR DOMAIN-containing deubiquitinating enzyme 4-like isoform X2 [Salvia miltiorrhiza]|uniref:OVARIAN TUMOR DOMAIN-containing deubiquitinating enzyme 4-like isoform X2 n=1 Tax=Salvia miltiorrhiza TaxID=226208 RepID=UPI0025AC7D51|nr:OVARIAN TUMOR DOMAIN-containing deubiquitinating enzyme 4-like isoform X2 [Salvia miltiorrhiza]XP_057768822.1 OVARIAN TUMOR DOMAIN-containing deubiquitinating enzyme 4-like isoform X2 [Salvia miltiorrhiza]